MNHDLVEAIRRSGAELASVLELETRAAEDIASRLADTHVADSLATWWWSSLASESVAIDYKDGAEGLQLLEMLTAGIDELYLLVTDDNSPHSPGLPKT